MYTVKLDLTPLGYALSSGRAGDQIPTRQQEFVSSEDGDLLISRLEEFPAEVLSMLPGGGPLPATVVYLLTIVRPDKSADVYVNDDLQIITEVQPKRSFQAGEPVMTDDIADVLKLSFRGVELPDDAGILFLFSIGWRKGLYYDFRPLGPAHPLRDYDMESALGKCSAYLMSQNFLKIEEAEWKGLMSQGWFPFVSLKGTTIRQMRNYAKNQWNIDDLLDSIATEVRSGLGPATWESNPFFQPHAALLTQAAARYRDGDYISAVAILYPRIEGIMRTFLRQTDPAANPNQGNLAGAVTSLRGGRHEMSLLLPNKFLSFLKDVYFAGFDPASPSGLSRHTVAHGVAPSADFNLKSATVGFLILEQIRYYLIPIPAFNRRQHSRDASFV